MTATLRTSGAVGTARTSLPSLTSPNHTGTPGTPGTSTSAVRHDRLGRRAGSASSVFGLTEDDPIAGRLLAAFDAIPPGHGTATREVGLFSRQVSGVEPDRSRNRLRADGLLDTWVDRTGGGPVTTHSRSSRRLIA